VYNTDNDCVYSVLHDTHSMNDASAAFHRCHIRQHQQPSIIATHASVSNVFIFSMTASSLTHVQAEPIFLVLRFGTKILGLHSTTLYTR